MQGRTIGAPAGERRRWVTRGAADERRRWTQASATGERRRWATTAAVLAALAAATPAAAGAAERDHEHEHARAQPRLVVADGTNGGVRVFAVRDGRAVGRLQVAGPANLTPAPDGRHVLAAQGTRNRVDVVDAGAWSEQHGDHQHHHTAAPRITTFGLAASKPAHVVTHGDEIAVFADGAGTASVFTSRDLTRPAPAPRMLATSLRPHHGVAVPMGERLVVSQPSPDPAAGSLPERIEVVDRTGAVLAEAGCPRLHGETSHGAWAALACEDGIALVTDADPGAAPRVEKLAYPAGADAERRAFALQTDAAGRRLVGGFGDRELVVFDLAARSARPIAVGGDGEIASFAIDGPSGAIVALTTDGLLRRIDPGTGRETAVRRVVGGPFTSAHGAPSPRLAVAGGRAAVSDPRAGRVTVVDTRALKVIRAVAVTGAPTSVALVG